MTKKPATKREFKYTVREIDDLRDALRRRYIWGNADGRACSSPYRESELVQAVEEQVRTYMMAGVKANEIYKEDGRE